MSWHYHVYANIPGYLPEGDVDYATTRGEAVELLKERKERILDQDAMLDENPRRMFGNARRDLGYHYHDPNNPFDLGLYISASLCAIEECAREESYA